MNSSKSKMKNSKSKIFQAFQFNQSMWNDGLSEHGRMPPVLAHSRESYENSHYYIITQEKYKLITAEREMSEGMALALNATFKV